MAHFLRKNTNLIVQYLLIVRLPARCYQSIHNGTTCRQRNWYQPLSVWLRRKCHLDLYHCANPNSQPTIAIATASGTKIRTAIRHRLYKLSELKFIDFLKWLIFICQPVKTDNHIAVTKLNIAINWLSHGVGTIASNKLTTASTTNTKKLNDCCWKRSATWWVTTCNK